MYVQRRCVFWCFKWDVGMVSWAVNAAHDSGNDWEMAPNGHSIAPGHMLWNWNSLTRVHNSCNSARNVRVFFLVTTWRVTKLLDTWNLRQIPLNLRARAYCQAASCWKILEGCSTGERRCKFVPLQPLQFMYLCCFQVCTKFEVPTLASTELWVVSCCISRMEYLLALYYLDPVTNSTRSVWNKTSAKGVFKGKLMRLTFKVVTQCDGISKNECQRSVNMISFWKHFEFLQRENTVEATWGIQCYGSTSTIASPGPAASPFWTTKTVSFHFRVMNCCGTVWFHFFFLSFQLPVASLNHPSAYMLTCLKHAAPLKVWDTGILCI